MGSLLSLLFLFLQLSSALKFDLFAGHSERCIRNFVGQDQLVMVTAIVSGHKGDGQKVNMHVSYAQFVSPVFNSFWVLIHDNNKQIKDALGNEHGHPKDVAGELRQTFTSSFDTAFDVCFENQLVGHRMSLAHLPQTQAFYIWSTDH